jgi:methylmalonyl-CoA mutase C-terminal domain/subunit
MHPARIVVGLFGIDQHEVGSIAVSMLLRDAGMEVIYAGRYQTPASLVRIAQEEDADAIGISCHSWEYLGYAPELLALIDRERLDLPVVLGGSVITPADAAAMRAAGIAAVFGAHASPQDMIDAIRELVARRRQRQTIVPSENSP